MTITALAPIDIYRECSFDDDGNPDEHEFASALTMWVACQDRTVTVAEAAVAFNATPEVIRKAANADSSWLYLTSDDTLECDGE